jgi:hypothetical protein
MINPIDSVHPMHATQVAHPPAEPRPDPHAQAAPVARSGEVSLDQLTLKSAGQPDPDQR